MLVERKGPELNYTPSQEAVEKAVEKASDRLYSSIFEAASNAKISVLMGPNIDASYWDRMGNDRVKKWLDSAVKALPRTGEIPKEFFDLLVTSSFMARQAQAKGAGRLVVAKHFPGGPKEVNETHYGRVALTGTYNGTSFEGVMEWNATSPFARIIKNSPPSGIMTSHVCYPGLIKDLRRQYPAIENPGFEDAKTPASISPHIIKGLLRDRLHYGGLVYADFVDMKAFDEAVYFPGEAKNKQLAEKNAYVRDLLLIYTKRMKKLRERKMDGTERAKLQNVEKESFLDAQKITLCILAGNNVVGRWAWAEKMPEYIEELYKSNREFAKRYDYAAAETLMIELQRLPPPQNKYLKQLRESSMALSVTDMQLPLSKLSQKKAAVRSLVENSLKLLTVEGRLQLMILPGKKITEAMVQDFAPNKKDVAGALGSLLTYYRDWSDSWNRLGLLSVEFRKNVIEELTGRKYPSLEILSMSREKAWFGGLMSDPQFRKAYYSINWNSAWMKKAYSDAMEKLVPR